MADSCNLCSPESTSAHLDIPFCELFEQTSQPSILFEDGHFIAVNRASLALFGMTTKEQLIGLTPDDISPQRQPNGQLSREMAINNVQQAIEHGHYELEWQCQKIDGTPFLIRLLLTAIRLDNRNLIYAVFSDITEQKQAENALMQSEERFRHLFELTKQPTMLVEEGHIIAANQASLDMLGLKRTEELIGLTPVDLSPQRQPNGQLSSELAAQQTQIALEQGSCSFEWEGVRSNGESFFIHLLLTSLQLDGRPVIHAVMNDITEQKKANERARYLAYYDQLTGLPNKISAYEQLTKTLEKKDNNGFQLAVIQIGLNKFKFFSNVHGRQTGDQLLQSVAERLKKGLRSDDAAYRLTADRFLLTLSGIDNKIQISNACHKIQRLLDAPHQIGETLLNTPVSLGIAVYPQDGSDSETLIRHADMALTEAKQTNRGTSLFYEGRMKDKQQQFIQIRDELQHALEKREFVLYYQPKLDLKSCQVCGAEALIRWNHPRRGLLPPSEFIDIAESSGAIIPISRWVLQEACRQMACWHADGWPELTIAVNISPIHFYQNAIADDVANALHLSELPASALELELTESVLVEQKELVSGLFNQWKQQGIQLAIDDFGTGYSSLAYLSRFSIDKLKIDRSFVINLDDEPKEKAIVKAILELADSLGMTTIAEGIEDRQMALQLEKMGCQQGQGYLYSKPLPAAEFSHWLNQFYPLKS